MFSKSPLASTILHFRFAEVARRSGRYALAAEHYQKIIDANPRHLSSLFQLGTLSAECSDFEQAEYYLKRALSVKDDHLPSALNLGAVYLRQGRWFEGRSLFVGHLSSLELRLEAQSGRRELRTITGQLLHNCWLANRLELNCATREWVECLFWRLVRKFESIPPSSLPSVTPIKLTLGKLYCCTSELNTCCHESITVFCVKWGTKYSSETVNRMARNLWSKGSFSRCVGSCCDHIEREHCVRIICLTDDAAGVDDGVIVKPLPPDLPRWWGKAAVFNDHGQEGRLCIYIDLDSAIVGDIEAMCSHLYDLIRANSRGSFFTTLSSKVFGCDGEDGLNTSVMVWRETSKLSIVNHMFRWLSFSAISLLIRFDFWVELFWHGQGTLDRFLCGREDLQITEYSFGGGPIGSIVAFPRRPKLEDCKELWVKEYLRS